MKKDGDKAEWWQWAVILVACFVVGFLHFGEHNFPRALVIACAGGLILGILLRWLRSSG